MYNVRYTYTYTLLHIGGYVYISGVKGYYSMFSLGYNSRLRELGMEKQIIGCSTIGVVIKRRLSNPAV